MKGYRYKVTMEGFNEGLEFYVYQLPVPDEQPVYKDVEAVEFSDEIAKQFATKGSKTPPRAVLVDIDSGDVFKRFEYEWK